MINYLGFVGSLSGRVREMMDKIEKNSQSHGGDVGSGRLAWKGVSREDMRVLHEQEKKQSSVVLRGFNSVIGT